MSNTVEYLGQLLESRAFIDNTYDTSWLDTVLSEKAAAEGRSDPSLMHLTSSWQPSSQDVVLYAAVWRAYKALHNTIACPVEVPYPILSYTDCKPNQRNSLTQPNSL